MSRYLTDNETTDLLRLRLEQTGKRVAMAAFARGNAPEHVDNNGTISLIQSPLRKLVVTNHHVRDAFLKERDSDPGYRLLMTGKGFCSPIDISDCPVVAESDRYDLCILDYPPERIEKMGKEFCLSPNWPPRGPNLGEYVAVAGYPGMRRYVEDISHPDTREGVTVLRHEICLLYLVVEAISDWQIRLTFRSNNPEVINFSNRPIEEYKWGGMSGSLAYRYDSEEERFIPCGILSAASVGTEAVFYATRLDVLSEDGTFRND